MVGLLAMVIAVATVTVVSGGDVVGGGSEFVALPAPGRAAGRCRIGGVERDGGRHHWVGVYDRAPDR